MNGADSGDPSAAPGFPPLYRGVRVSFADDPLSVAKQAAEDGADGGVIFWSDRSDRMEAALVLAPEKNLEASLAMALAAQQALTDALGALAPPNTAVQWGWPDQLFVNGGRAGRLRLLSDTRDPEATPEWLIVAPTVQIASFTATQLGGEPGRRPDLTALREEGCGEVDATRLIEAWARYLLVWIISWEEDGFRPLHEAWSARSAAIGRHAAFDLPGGVVEGDYIGLDDVGGLLLKSGEAMRAFPLSLLLDRAAPWPPEGPPSPRVTPKPSAQAGGSGSGAGPAKGTP